MDIKTPLAITEAVATVIAELLREQRKTSLQLSEDAGIPRATLSRRLNHYSPFTTDELERIGRVLNTPVSVIIARAEGITRAVNEGISA
ncbi:MAG: helix-turn-helix transcriptional regulator [Actinomycetaceae bacterium]|nr:helix-turn-helix transcriptional regulator [Actinomycetaceae bacterium]